MTFTRHVMGLSWILLVACGGSQEAAPPPAPAPAAAPAPEPEPTPAAAATPPAEAAKPPAEPAKPAPPKPIWRVTEGVATPESVLYDEASDRYLVSNINGKPTEADNNGYIMEISPDGKVTNPKFIAGGANKVKLDAPKGSGIADGVLYVSDIKVVRQFDAKTGAPKGDIPIPGATFLNDISVGPDKKVYVTDTGWKMGKEGFEPTGTDAVYVIEKGKAKAIVKSKELGNPNGVLATDKGPWVAASNGELYRLDEKGVRMDLVKLPQAGLDGIVATGDGNLLISSWKASAVYKGKPSGPFEVVISDVSAPADIGYDSKRKRVLVPRFMDSAVEAYELK